MVCYVPISKCRRDGEEGSRFEPVEPAAVLLVNVVLYSLSSFGAEGRSRTGTELPPTVFETAASTIPPLRQAMMP